MTLSSPEPQGGSRSWIGSVPLGLLLGYTAMIHHGLGPERAGHSAWYIPTRFLYDFDFIYALIDPSWLAFVSLGLPALLLLGATLLFTRAATAAAIGTSCVLATVLFVFYGVVAPFPWQFFGWRGSAVLILIALAVGFALTAPLLARSWLRLGWPLRILSYLPFVALMIGFLRNATGTDDSLPFAISPWPAVPVFGMEVGCLFAAIWWIGTAVGTLLIARSGGSRGRIALAVLAGLFVPALLLLAGSALHLFPFRVGVRLLVTVALVCAASIALAATLRLHGPDALRARARHIAVGAVLLTAPLLAGQAWAYLDYYVTREVRAREIIDALQAYLERESLYPDSLEALVAAGDLETIPRPSIGFDFLYDGEFDYQSFGTSFLMQFPAPRWVQCAYTPAPVYDEDELEELEEDEQLGESWSCPSRPPELW